MNSVVDVTFMRKNDIYITTGWFLSQTVMGMKVQIYIYTKVPIENQILAINGRQLPDEYTREDCGIHDDGCRVQFFLKTDTVAIKVLWEEKKIVVHANVLSTIQQVKAQMIPRIAAVFTEDPDFHEDPADPNKFDLSLWGDWLNENSTVLALNLKDADEMRVLKRRRVELTVNESSQTWLYVNLMLSLQQFRQQLNRDLGIPLNAIIHLVGHGVMDSEFMRLFMYKIENGSKLTVTFSPLVTHDFTHLLR